MNLRIGSQLPHRTAQCTVAGLVALALLTACARDEEVAGTPLPPPILPPGPSKLCVVLLHGKGGGAGPSTTSGGVEYLRPGGNGSGWGGSEWRYFPDAGYEQVRSIVTTALDAAGCGRAVVQGFSNGAAAAAKLYCRGASFSSRVVGYIVDDPVTDSAVLGCSPVPAMQVRLYWTGALAMATDGWSCTANDWTCEGGSTIGIARYAQALGTVAAPSIHTSHTEYANPPEVVAWLAPPGG